MNQEIKEKLAKIYALVEQGSPGEKEAAKAALDRLLQKYNLDESVIASIKKKSWAFKYSKEIDKWLFRQLYDFLFPGTKMEAGISTLFGRDIYLELEYVDYVVFSSMFEYYKSHMGRQYRQIVTPQLKRFKSAKNKKARRAKLDELFFDKYIRASKLYRPEDLQTVDLSKVSERELRDRLAMNAVEGGVYHTPLSTGLYLDAHED